MSATVSVVVGVTDGNAPFLGDCLAALTAQERRPDEVLLAVSGTGADTAAAVTAAVHDGVGEGCSLVTLAGDADEGARQASGDYLVLVEAGDLLTPTALGALAGSLDETGADLALPSSPTGPGARSSVTLAEVPQAITAVDLATMMLRAGFWHEAGLASLRDPVAEWLPAVHAVARARVFDVVDEQVRRGARRGTGVAFSAMPGVAPHLPRVLPAVEEVLARLADPPLRPAREHLVHWLLSEVVAEYLEDAERCDEDTWLMLVAFVRELVADVGADLVPTVPVESRVRVWLAAQERRAELEAFNAARWHEEGDFPTRVRDARVFAVLPVEDVPEHVLELSETETPLETQLRRARWNGGGLELEVVAFAHKLGADAGPARVSLALVTESGLRVDLDAEPLTAPEVNPIAGERHHEHADGLYRTRVDVARLATHGPAAWALSVAWDRAGVRRVGEVRTLERRGSAAALPPMAVGDGEPGLELSLDPASVRLVLGPPQPTSAGPDPSGPEVTGLQIDGDVLEVTGTAPSGPHTLRLRGPRGVASVRVQGTGGTFTARLALRHDPWSLGETPLPPGSYRLRLAGPDGPGKLPLGPGLAARTPYVERSASFRMRVERNPDGSAQLVLGPPLADDEAGPRAQHELRRWYATDEHRLDPTTVYLQSYAGLSATDSPLAIHHELRRTRPELRLVWGAVDSSVVLPEGAERVLLRSRAWYEELSRCGHIVTNVDMDDWFRKRPGQRLLQTYHGYPAKAMGVMAWEAKNFTPSIIARHLRRTSATWDLLLTPHPSMDVHYREQYRYTGPILSGGYPRDDELVGPDAGVLREDTRRRLGIGDRTAVLYAPTWRDDLTTNFRAAVMPSTFDVETAAATLGDDYVILLRGHRFHRQRPEMRGRLVDVTNYPEINHLVLAADVAVLDYSSLRFDVALARRPMIFLVPDLARYESGVRGFLYDFRSSAPGPLVDTTAEVVDALRDLDGVRRQHRAAYDQFQEQFNALQDGHSAERAVQTFFG